MAIPRGRLKTALLYFLLIASGALFLFRGPIRAIRDHDINDLISPYVQAKVWLHGGDPYSAQSMARFWPAKGLTFHPDPQQVEDGSLLIKHGIPTAYPLACFVMLAPLTFLSWPVFKGLFVLLTVTLLAGAIRSLVTISRLDSPAALLLTGSAFLLAPIQTGMATLNIAILAIELGVIAMWADQAERKIVAGVLVGVCTALKPQLGIGFLLYYIVRRNWRLTAWGMTSIFATEAAGILRLYKAHAHWWQNYILDNQALVSTGVLGDFTDKNPTRFGLVNLQVALFPLLKHRAATEICVLGFCTLLVLMWFFAMSKRDGSDTSLLPVSAIILTSLIPIYHRFYDAALLIIPICYLLDSLRNKAFRPAVIALMAAAVFLVPGGSFLEVIVNKGLIPRWLASGSFWQSFVMAHDAWSIAILASMLIYEMAMQLRGKDPSVTEPKSLMAA